MSLFSLRREVVTLLRLSAQIYMLTRPLASLKNPIPSKVLPGVAPNQLLFDFPNFMVLQPGFEPSTTRYEGVVIPN